MIDAKLITKEGATAIIRDASQSELRTADETSHEASDAAAHILEQFARMIERKPV